MIILDTNVISALMRRQPDQLVLQWLDRQPASSIWTTTITLMELRYGLQSMPEGNRRRAMQRELENVLNVDIDGRCLSFDSAAAQQSADLMAMRKLKGRTVEIRDNMIAGIVLATKATLATRNTNDFSDLHAVVVNPWNAS
jgi:hypothetical protein